MISHRSPLALLDKKTGIPYQNSINSLSLSLSTDLQHHLFSLTFDGNLVVAPIPKEKVLHRVLDIGTGTGIWAIDFADEHPETQVLGVDLSPIQPPL
jgi:tRNA1(Val) A37 N6-methylase TrmN6